MSFSGVIKKYGQKGLKGFGFISSEEAARGSEIFFSRRSLPAEFQAEFQFHLLDRECVFDLVEVGGNPQAHNIKIRIGSDGQFLGIVKSFNRGKGFGSLQSSFFPGQEVFFMKSDLPDNLQRSACELQGQIAQCLYHDDDGRPQAKKLSFGGIGVHEKWLPWTPPVDANKTRSFVPRYCGSIKSFNPHKGFGSIEYSTTYEHWECDVYFKDPNITVQVGVKVVFEVQCRDGKPQARNIRIGYQGRLQSYGKERGFGFIKCDDTYKVFGRDVYVSKEQFEQSACSGLDEVLFEVYQGKNGEPKAFNMQVVAQESPFQKDREEHSANSEASSTLGTLCRSDEMLTSNSTTLPVVYIPQVLVMCAVPIFRPAAPAV